MTQSNDLPSRMDRAEDSIIDLRLAASALLQVIDKNSADIAALIEATRHLAANSRRHDEEMAALRLSQMRTEAALQVFQQHTDEAIARMTATDERLERLLEYMIRRDQGQPD